jgi:hypothetical protein
MKTLLGVLLYRPGYNTILEQLVKVNPGLEADLALTNDTGMELDINESLTRAWGSVTVIDDPSDIFEHIRAPVNGGKLKKLCFGFKRIALWQNTLLLYALQEGYDNLLIWEDDQVFNFNGAETDAFFSPQIDTLNRNGNIDVCVSKRRGYLHRIPPFITKHIPWTVLDVLEESLCLCNEIVYSGLMTEPGGGFVPYDAASPYGGVEYFGNRSFIYAGSLAINLRTSFPCFYDVPDLPGQHFSRGNDTFFSLGYDGGMVAREAGNTYFHDPYMVTTCNENGKDCFAKPVDCGSVDNFLTLIKGWFSYSCLLLRLAFPDDWNTRIKEIDSLLKHLPAEFESIYHVFNEYALRVGRDHTAYANTLEAWRMICGEIRSA